MNVRDEIAVTDCSNHRVQIFNTDGKYLKDLLVCKVTRRANLGILGE